MLKILNLELNKEIQDFFSIFDTDNNGFINFIEFYNVLKSFGITRSKYEIKDMFNEIDKNRNGVIEYDEIINYCNSTINYNDINNIIDAFYIIDNTKKGYITLNDLIIYIKKTCIKVEASKIIEDFKVEDIDRDEQITLTEFIKMIERKNNITNFKLIGDLLVFVTKLETKNLIDPKCKKETYEKYNFLKEYELFSKIYRSRLLRFCNKIKIINYPFNEIICNEEMVFDHFYIVNSNFIEVRKKIDNLPRTIGVKGRGFIIGINEYFENKTKYNYSILSCSNCCNIYKIPVKQFDILKEIDKVFYFRFRDLYLNVYKQLFEKFYIFRSKPIKLKPLPESVGSKIKRKNYSQLGKNLDVYFMNNQSLQK